MSHRVLNTSDVDAAVEAAAAAVRAGEVIVLPTDTVYGGGADAVSAEAVQRLLDAKRRGRDMPPPVLVSDVAMVRTLARDADPRITALGEAFWPGALTLIVTAPSSLRMDLGDRGDTIAVRVPDHDFTRELLRATGPLAVSSANVSGEDAALSISEAVDQLGDTIAVYLDAGEASGPVPSTIVDLSGDHPRLLRAGRITIDELNAVVPGLIDDTPSIDQAEADALAAGEASERPDPVEEAAPSHADSEVGPASDRPDPVEPGAGES